MKKILLLFSSMFWVASADSQTDAGIILQTAPSSDTTSGNCYMTNLPSGESIVGTNIHSNSSPKFHIAITKIDLTGNISLLNNIIIPDSLGSNLKIRGLSCSTNGDYTCLLSNYLSNYLIKFSASNSIIWQKKIEHIGFGGSEYYSNTFLETNSGDYYLTISDWYFLGIVKIDSNGNLLWNKKMIGPVTASGSGVYYAKSPGFCTAITATGGCISTLKDNQYECVVNLAPDGTLLWSRTFVDYITYRWPRSIKMDSDGNYLILGMIGYGGVSATSTFHKIDTNGNILFAKYFDDTPANQFSYTDFMILPNNETVFFDPYATNTLTKLDSNLSFVWSKKINGTISFSANIKKFSSQPSNNICFLTNVNPSTPVIFNFSDTTEVCSSQDFPFTTLSNDNIFLSSEVDTTIAISNLNINISSSTFSTTSTNYYYSQNFCSYIASVNETTASVSLNIYPNPATDFVNIELGNLKNEDLQNAVLVIYNITGQKVFEKQLNTSSMDKISTADYSAGLYTIVISNSKKILAKQRMVVQK